MATTKTRKKGAHAVPKSETQSKPETQGQPEVLRATIATLDGTTVAVLYVNPKAFKTGNTGYFGSGKVEVNGVRYQGQVQFARIRGQ